MALKRIITILGVGVLIGLVTIVSKINADVIITKVEGEAMTLPASGGSIVNDPLASGGQTAKINQNGDITGSLNLDTPTNYFKFVAKGDYCRGNWPRLMVYVDNTRVYNQLVSTSTLTEFQINTALSAGNHQLRYNFSNASSNATCARALYVDVANFFANAPPAPTLNFSATATTLNYGDSTTLNWSSANTSACNASGSWSGSQPLSGAYATGSLDSNQSYTLTCTGAGGQISQTVNVTVLPPPPPPAPTVVLTANPSSLETGQSSELNWSTNNADSCGASGTWSGDKALNGSESTGLLTVAQTYVYILTCTGPGGQTSVATEVIVSLPPPPPAPTVNLTANPSSIYINSSSLLNWIVTDADSCEASGDWAGSKTLSGTEETPNLSTNATYILTCSGAGGQTTDVASVTVLPYPAPTLNFSADSTNLTTGQGTNLIWSTTGADSCEASGAWNGSKSVSGIESTGTLDVPQTYSYTLECTGPGGITTQTVNIVVDAPAPASCTVADTSGCTPGHEIVLNNTAWTCSQPLANYGTLPLKVTVNATQTYNNTGVTLTTGCAGDSDPNTIDLILDVKGNGLTYGPNQDAVKTKLQAGYNNGIQITGKGNCGPRASAQGHQDGVQAQGGRNITFVDFYIGDYDNGTSTCQGAGGAVFYSGANGYTVQNLNIIRGKYIACVKGLGAGGSNTGTVVNSVFRSGRTDGSDPVCVGYNAPRTCLGAANVLWTNVLCEKWNSSSDIWEYNQQSYQ